MVRNLIALMLAGIAAGAVKLAAKVAPQREVDVFPHRLYAKGRPWWHVDVYAPEPTWWFVEFGGWTIELAWKTREEMAA